MLWNQPLIQKTTQTRTTARAFTWRHQRMDRIGDPKQPDGKQRADADHREDKESYGRIIAMKKSKTPNWPILIQSRRGEISMPRGRTHDNRLPYPCYSF